MISPDIKLVSILSNLRWVYKKYNKLINEKENYVEISIQSSFAIINHYILNPLSGCKLHALLSLGNLSKENLHENRTGFQLI